MQARSELIIRTVKANTLFVFYRSPEVFQSAFLRNKRHHDRSEKAKRLQSIVLTVPIKLALGLLQHMTYNKRHLQRKMTF